MKKMVEILEEFGLNSDHTSEGTDKGCFVSYVDKFYETEFNRYRKENYKIKLLELGIRSGASLKLWKEYFLNSEIIAGIDRSSNLIKKQWANLEGVSYYIGDIYNNKMAESVKEVGPYDIIIDDADHSSSCQAKAIDLYLPLLKEGGLYIIEDISLFKYPNVMTQLIDALPEKYKNSYQFLDFREYKNKLHDDMIMVIRG